MNMYHLKIFTYIAKYGSITRAAEELGISQPAVSHQIQDFQDKLELQLINMIGKKLHLTDAGLALYEEGKKLVEIEKNSEEIQRDFLNQKSGRIKILSSTSFSAYYLPEIIKRFKQHYPDIFIEIVSRDSFTVVEEVASLYYDVGFIAQRIENPKTVTRSIIHEDIVAVMPIGHHLSDKNFIEPEDLLNQELIVHEKQSGCRVVSDKYFNQHDIKLKVNGIYDNSETIKNLVKKYSCISMMSITDVIDQVRNKELIAIPFKPSMLRNYYMVFHKKKYLSKPLKKFLDISEEWGSIYSSVMSENFKDGRIKNYSGINVI